MNGGEWMVVMIVAIIMIGKFLTAGVRHGARHARCRDARQSDPDSDRLREEIRTLKDRIAVLERIATDKSTALEREIEALRTRD